MIFAWQPFRVDGSPWPHFITWTGARVLKDTALAAFSYRSSPVVHPLINDNTTFCAAAQAINPSIDFSSPRLSGREEGKQRSTNVSTLGVSHA